MVKAQSVRCCCLSCTSRVVGVGVGGTAAAVVGVGVDGEPTGMSVICMSVQIRQRSCVIQAGAVSLVGVTVTTYRQIGCRRWPSCAVFAVAPWRPLPMAMYGSRWVRYYSGQRSRRREAEEQEYRWWWARRNAVRRKMVEIIEFYAGSCPCGLS